MTDDVAVATLRIVSEVRRAGRTAWRDWWPWLVLAAGIAVVTVGGLLYSP